MSNVSVVKIREAVLEFIEETCYDCYLFLGCSFTTDSIGKYLVKRCLEDTLEIYFQGTP